MEVTIIGEIGINHNGNLDTALKLIDQAKWAGFDAVKFQKRNPDYYSDDLYDSPLFGRVPYREHKRRLELSYNDYIAIDAHCILEGIDWFASCFDKESVDFIAQFKPDYWKIASPSFLDHELVEYIACQEGFVIASTGMCTWQEMNDSVEVLSRVRRYDEFALLHCCSQYPTPPEHVNLNFLQTMATFYPCKVGYSSHDAGVPTPAASVLYGAEIVEVHITLSRAMPGSDHGVSLEREEMERLVRHIRNNELIQGSFEKQFYDEEKRIRAKVATKRANC